MCHRFALACNCECKLQTTSLARNGSASQCLPTFQIALCFNMIAIFSRPCCQRALRFILTEAACMTVHYSTLQAEMIQLSTSSRADRRYMSHQVHFTSGQQNKVTAEQSDQLPTSCWLLRMQQLTFRSHHTRKAGMVNVGSPWCCWNSCNILCSSTSPFVAAMSLA